MNKGKDVIFSKLHLTIPVSLFPPVSPVWSVPVCGLCHASVGASIRGNLVGLQPAPSLCHQKGAVRQEHWKVAGPMSSGHHSLCQSPVTRQTYGLYWAVACEVCNPFTLYPVCVFTVILKCITLSHLCRCCGGRNCSLSSVTGRELLQTTASYWLLLKVDTFQEYNQSIKSTPVLSKARQFIKIWQFCQR